MYMYKCICMYTCKYTDTHIYKHMYSPNYYKGV